MSDRMTGQDGKRHDVKVDQDTEDRVTFFRFDSSFFILLQINTQFVR